MTEKAKDTRTEGAYVAYSEDFTAVAVFSSEVQALRYAVDAGLKVKRIPFGVDLREAVKADASPPTGDDKVTAGITRPATPTSSAAE